ncbi:hypothetical protein BHG07_09435 [Brenneria salicis ATCC 15712 = DSM 30166]|nr:hypothetical protein BHG07_09435 [Brenneria salicis ATCC 15712 = DSM 30166]
MRGCFEPAFQRDLRNRNICRLQQGETPFETCVQQNPREAVSRFRKPAAQACLAHGKVPRHFRDAPRMAKIGFDQTPHFAKGQFFISGWKTHPVVPQPDQGFEKSMLPDRRRQAFVVERIPDKMEYLKRSVGNCAQDLDARRAVPWPLVGENGIDQFMREAHAIGPVAVFQDRAIFHRHHRTGRKNHQISCFADQLPIVWTKNSFGPGLNKKQKRQSEV